MDRKHIVMNTPTLFRPDKTWTLFLDRDGVINIRPHNDYVKALSEFQFLDGVEESVASLSEVFGRIIVVTNQQGIGKGLMQTRDLDQIHEYMVEKLQKSGGRIDKVYYCGDLKNSGSFYRKPAIGMALNAIKDFPDIFLTKSVMVGDTLTDMIFGKRLKMVTVLIDSDMVLARKNPRLIDLRFHSLRDFAATIRNP